MAGYSWTPRFRLTPTDGAVETVALDTASMSHGGLLKTKISYRPEIEKREDVNRRKRPRQDGYRPEVTLRWFVGGDMADAALIVKVANALMRYGTVVELSLDGGTVYREVVLAGDVRGPEAADSKTFAGAEYELRVECTDLIDEIPAVGSGSW